MKKIFIVAIAMIALSLGSCGNKSNSVATDDDSVTVDSTGTATVELSDSITMNFADSVENN